MLSIAVLGEVEATRDGVRLRLPSGKTSELLARLAVEPGVPVRVDTLVEDLWGATVDRNTLQAKVSQLRRAIGRDVVRGSSTSYVLDVGLDSVDASRVARLSHAVVGAASAEVVALAEEGVSLFRGVPLVGQQAWAAPYRTALEEIRWSLVEHLMAARVELGGGGELVPDLERLLEEQPLRESLWARLMTALYRAGRQADALAAYGRARRHLVDELGIEPGPELVALEAQVLAHGDDLGARPRAVGAAGNLPPHGHPIVGRDADISAAADELDENRLVTLVGPAGVGKTRLALEVAARRAPAGGAWLVRLDAVDRTADRSELVEMVAGALHTPPDQIALGERLRGAPTLIVLDNCEHVVEEAADLARWLGGTASWTTVLATSQLPLGLDEESVVEVAPLTRGDAVALFEHLVARSRRGALRDDEHALVREVCDSLDGLPLAIELAATRVPSLPVSEIARRLDDRFALLRDASRPTSRRHALEAALTWSYDLLFPDDQRTLQALSTFAGGATLTALEDVAAALDVPHMTVADTLARLVDRSLVTLDVSSQPRYRLLDSVRALARLRLRQSGDADRALAAHATTFAVRASECARAIRGPAQSQWIDFVRAERADVDAALDWAATHDRRLGERIALGLAWAWAVLGDGSAAAARVRAAVGDDAPPQTRFSAALAASWLEASAGNLALAREDLATATANAPREPRPLADLAWHRAFVAIQDGQAGEVVSGATAALETYHSMELTWESGAALVVLAYGMLMGGEAHTAAVRAEEAVELIRRTGDSWGLTHAHGILAGVAEALGDFLAAAPAFAEAANAAGRLDFAGQRALHLASRARILVRVGDPAARAAVREALDAAGAVGDGRLCAALRIQAAQLARRAGAVEEARALLRENAAWYATSGGGDHAALTEVLLAALGDDTARLRELLETDLDPAARQAALDATRRLTGSPGGAVADGIAVPGPDIALRVDRVD